MKKLVALAALLVAAVAWWSLRPREDAPSAPAVLASNDRTTNSNFITVSNVRGFHEQE